MNNAEKKYPKIAADIYRAEATFPEYLETHFERILQKIELFWGANEAVKYFDELLLGGDRDNRHGFPNAALREIDLLNQIHTLYYQELEFNPHDPFSAGGVFAASMGAPKVSTAYTEKPQIGQTEAAPVVAKVTHPIEKIMDVGITQNTSDVMLSPVAQPEKPVVPRGHWPKIDEPHTLIELLSAGRKIYELQGKSIGDILLHYGFSDEPILHAEYKKAARHHLPIGQFLVNHSIITQEDLDCALCVQYGIIMVDLLTIEIPAEVSKLIPINKAREKQVVPVAVYDGTLLLAVAEPLLFKESAFFAVLTGLKILAIYAPRHEIVSRLNSHIQNRLKGSAAENYHSLAQKAFDAVPEKPVTENVPQESDLSENDSTIINLVNSMIMSAIDEAASDIHIEMFQGGEQTDIRFRQDGRMENFSSFPSSYHNAVVSRIKIMAGLDISEKRRPQDGKISFRLPDGGYVDLRVSIMPAMRGIEFVTIRILTSGEPLPLSDLGMIARDMDVFREMAHHTYGLILVCGPTGSGKTTTLHSVLKELNTTDRKIWTVEDPVEIVQPHLCQVQINNKIGVTFAALLRSLLRADPDIIMIGEMRDQETAKIALEASMTGHLVLSTLHTNSASETVARLLDLGVDPYNLSDALLAILAQRLARKLCLKCAKSEVADQSELNELANEYYQSAHGNLPAHAEREALIQQWRDTFGKEGQITLKRPVGCDSCSEGYAGRIGLYEMLRATADLRTLIRHQSSAFDYQKLGVTEGMHTLKQDGIEKILSGLTDLAQVHYACA